MQGMVNLPPKAKAGWLPMLGILLLIAGGAGVTFGVFGTWTGGVPPVVMTIGGVALLVIGLVLLKLFAK